MKKQTMKKRIRKQRIMKKMKEGISGHWFLSSVLLFLLVSFLVVPALAQTKQDLTQQVNNLIARADALLKEAGAPPSDGGGFFSNYWWLILIIIGVGLLAWHGYYRWRGLDTEAVNARIRTLLELAQQKLLVVQKQFEGHTPTPNELQIWSNTIGNIRRQWEHRTGLMRWPIRSKRLRAILSNGLNQRDPTTGNVLFAPWLQDQPAAGGTPANPARARFLEDVAMCLEAILVAQQLLRREIGSWFYPRIVRLNAIERKLQGRIVSPVVHPPSGTPLEHTVTFTYDTRLSAPGVTQVNLVIAGERPQNGLAMAQSGNGQFFTLTIPRHRGNHTYFFKVWRGGVFVDEFDPLNMNRRGTFPTWGGRPPNGSTFSVP